MKNFIIHRKFQDDESATDNDLHITEFNSQLRKNSSQLPKPTPKLQKQESIEEKTNRFLETCLKVFICTFSFGFLLKLGHFYLSLVVVIASIVVFQELMVMRLNTQLNNALPHQNYLNWYFFFVSAGYSYGKLLTSKLTTVMLKSKYLLLFAQHSEFICFVLWMIGVFVFLKRLKRGYYKYQISQFGWTHIGMIFIVGQASVIIINIYEGIIWFLFPALLLLTNQLYTNIIKLCIGKQNSLKTVGKVITFNGSLILQIFTSYYLAGHLQQYNYFICPHYNLTFLPSFKQSNNDIQCEIPHSFNKIKDYPQNDDYILNQLQDYNINFKDSSYFQLHAMIISIISCIIYHFSGKISRGLKKIMTKRNTNDEQQTITVGISGKMDSHLIMGMFVYLYLHQIILGPYKQLQGITHFLSTQDLQKQIIVYMELQNMIEQKLNPQNITIQEYIESINQQN